MRVCVQHIDGQKDVRTLESVRSEDHAAIAVIVAAATAAAVAARRRRRRRHSSSSSRRQASERVYAHFERRSPSVARRHSRKVASRKHTHTTRRLTFASLQPQTRRKSFEPFFLFSFFSSRSQFDRSFLNVRANMRRLFPRLNTDSRRLRRRARHVCLRSSDKSLRRRYCRKMLKCNEQNGACERFNLEISYLNTRARTHTEVSTAAADELQTNKNSISFVYMFNRYNPAACV